MRTSAASVLWSSAPGPRLTLRSGTKGRTGGAKPGGSAIAKLCLACGGSGFATLCLAYLAGIVATELFVFDVGPASAAYSFYATSLPSLRTWPQLLRIALPVLGISVELGIKIFDPLVRRVRDRRRLTWRLLAAGMLAVPGLLSLANSLAAAEALVDAWPSWRARLLWGASATAEVTGLLSEVRFWHTLMLATLLGCIVALQRGDADDPRK